MDIKNLESPPPSATFGQDASFRLDQPIGAMSISPSGRDVVLASKEGLHIIDLDSPFSPPRHLPHRTPWEVADVQWSPFAIRDYWIVSTSNQKALVWNVGVSGWRDAIEFVLHGHTRAITDINFSAHHPDMLATCAVDSFVHAWDLRAPSRPAFSFSDWFAGATQVKWSRQDEYVIASSHDRFLHIWDKRKGAYPARTIEAHGTKIYGLDWNRFEPTKIVTCSLDKTIKFWDVNNQEDIPDRVIETPFPVWRARHTPFGWGLLAMPQRSNSDLLLYDRRPVDGVLTNGPVQPAATFTGHKGHVKEFLWRARGTIKDGIDHRDFQLVSWGTDGELRLHKVAEDTFLSVDYEKGVSRPLRLNFTRRNARYRTFRDGTNDPYSPLDMPGRTDSNQTQPYHSSGSRARPSTNIAMSRIPVAQFRGWLQSGKRERRTGMHGRSTFRQDMSPIAWMKNVKIVSWGPDTLADEITQVGERFSKLDFEALDIVQRKAVLVFQGPWGENGASVYARADFRFPKTYPKDAAASITIHKSNSIDENVYKILSTEVRTIAETYASRQRGCIEAIVRYLFHEQTMEQIVSWLLDEDTADTKALSNVELADLSSDSDDDNLNGRPDPSNSSANLRVPIAKGCGALWSNTGELVCFFRQKSKEPMSILGRFEATGLEAPQSNKLFDRFGRLQTSSSTRRPGNSTQPTIDETASDVSDVDSTFSEESASTSSSDSDIGTRDRFMPFRTGASFGFKPRSRSPGGSNKSTTLDGTKIGEEVRPQIVSIHHDVKVLLPSQKTLAQRYMLSGPGSTICEHNAIVAEDASLPDIASVWRLASLLLEERVPLKILKSEGIAREDVAVVARQNTSLLRRKDSGIDLSFDGQKETAVLGSIRWGHHPLGAAYLVTAIFNYFEKLADVQTLAMLSCVLAQSENSDITSHQNVRRKSVALRSAYRPSAEIAESLARNQNGTDVNFTLSVSKPYASEKLEDNVAVPTLRETSNRRRNTASLAFRPDLDRHEDSGHRDVGITVDTSSSGTTLARANAMSTSTSPEESRFSRRANSGVAFAASRASLNALAQSFQHSPPSNNSTAGSSLKKFSPSGSTGWAGSLFGSAQNSRASRASQAPSEANSDDASNSHLRGSVSLANLQDLRRDSRRLRDSRGSLRSMVAAGSGGKNGVSGETKKRAIKTSLRNQDRFDLDGHADVPLLDADLRWKCQTYRSAYADQLGSWGLFLQQAELLRFGNQTPEGMRDRSRNHAGDLNYTPQLEITKCCIECGNTFAPIEKNGVPIGWHCTTISCHLSKGKPSKNQVCVICQQVMKGLSVPCLQCGHVTCYPCAEGWFGQLVDSDTETGQQSDKEDGTDDSVTLNSCPTGCGCSCPSLQAIEVPPPPRRREGEETQNLAPNPIFRQGSTFSVRSQRHKSETSGPPPGPDTALGAMMALSRSRAPSTSTTKVGTNTDHEGHGNAHHVDDLLPWSSGKFTSLGRGVGGGLSRGLSNRSSDATIRKV